MVKIRWQSKDGLTNKAKTTDITIHLRVGGKVTKKALSELKYFFLEDWDDDGPYYDYFDDYEHGPKNPIHTLEIVAKGYR